MRNLTIRPLFILVVAVFSSGCTHLHSELIPSHYKNIPNDKLENPQPNIQIIVTRGPLYFTHSAIRVQNNEKIYFWDPLGSYGMDEHAEYFKEQGLPSSFLKKDDLITYGVPNLNTYWSFAKYTADTGMEIFEWMLSNQQATHLQNVFYAGANDSDNPYDFDSQDTFLLCSSALSRFINRFVSDIVPLGETYFFPDSLAHKLYALEPDRIIVFEKGRETRVFSSSGNM